MHQVAAVWLTDLTQVDLNEQLHLKKYQVSKAVYKFR